MKTATLLKAAGLAALMAAASPAAAQTAIEATTDLNLRAGPGSNYPILSTIPNKGGATLGGCIESSKWCKVTYEGQEGWAYGDYLTADLSGSRVVVAERRADVGVPVATYEANAGAGVAGAATGAVAGAIIGGPIGAAVGGAIGLATGAAVAPPEQAVTYVRSNQLEPLYLEGEAVVGARLPEAVPLTPIPDYEYQYVYVNGQPVLVEPASRQIVYVVR